MKGFSLLQLSARLDHAKEVQQRLLRLLYMNLNSSLIVIVFNASLFTYILWPVAAHSNLIIWYGVLVFITLLRFIDTYRYFRQNHPVYRHWYRRLAAGVTASALMWGMVPLLFFPADEPAYQMFIILIVVGMSSGALSTLSADLRLSFIYLFALLLPLEYRLLEQYSVIHFATAVLVMAFIAVVTHAARQFHLSLVESYRHLEQLRMAKKRLSSSEKRLRMMFEQAPTGIFYYDTDLIIVDVNYALCQILQVERPQLVGLDLQKLPDERLLHHAYPEGDFTKPGVYVGPYHSKIKALDLWLKVEFMPLLNDHAEMVGGMAMVTDNTKEHAAMEETAFLSLHDPLTMLPNRKLLTERMVQLQKEQKRQSALSALLFLDLDRFKHINDSAGHLVGDQLLITTARRLKGLLRESDTLSRLGGDEFVILLPMISNDENEATRRTFQIAEKIHYALKQPYEIEEHTYLTSCSIGITMIEDSLTEPDEILRRADTAMYKAKEDGRDRTRFYDMDMDHKAQAYLHTLSQLQFSLTKEAFELHFQPIVRAENNAIVAAECLLRWRDDTGKQVPPSVFIPVAEDAGLITQIGRWVIKNACRQIAQWSSEGCFTLQYLSINISPRQLTEDDFSNFVLNTISNHNIEASQLRLEITETALIRNFDKTKQLIEELNHAGVLFIIDDFGTGYSSLSYLKQLSFSTLKIDKSFIRDIIDDPKDATLIRAVIDIARQFGYDVIAEGVEKEEQLAKLMLDSDTILFQGYLCSKAVDAETFRHTLLTQPTCRRLKPSRTKT